MFSKIKKPRTRAQTSANEVKGIKETRIFTGGNATDTFHISLPSPLLSLSLSSLFSSR